LTVPLWILLGAGGAVAGQVIGDDTARDNPQRLRKVEVDRHGDLAREWWDEDAGCWKPIVEVLRAEKWAEVKAHRDALEEGAAPTPFGAVQSNDRSKIRIGGLVQMADKAAAAGVPFEVEFTLADNSVLLADGPMMETIGLAVGQWVKALHAAALSLRAWIQSEARTAEDLAALDVAAEFAAALAPPPDPAP
jgi:hypothetical protein